MIIEEVVLRRVKENKYLPNEYVEILRMNDCEATENENSIFLKSYKEIDATESLMDLKESRDVIEVLINGKVLGNAIIEDILYEKFSFDDIIHLKVV